MVTNVDSIILDRYRFMYIMSVKKRLQVLIVLGILVNENEIESVRTRTDKN